jgi:hypothetical protein
VYQCSRRIESRTPEATIQVDFGRFRKGWSPYEIKSWKSTSVRTERLSFAGVQYLSALPWLKKIPAKPEAARRPSRLHQTSTPGTMPTSIPNAE